MTPDDTDDTDDTATPQRIIKALRIRI